jgi:hypothetical protein
MNAVVSVKQTSVNPPTRTFPLVADHRLPKGLPELVSIGFPFSKPAVDENIVLSNDVWKSEKQQGITAAAPFGFLFRTLPRLEDMLSITSLQGTYDPQTQTITAQSDSGVSSTYYATFREAPTGVGGLIIPEGFLDCAYDY